MGACQKHVAVGVWDPTLLIEGGGEMAKSMEVNSHGEVAYQELAYPSSHEPGGHGLRHPKSVWTISSSIVSKTIPWALCFLRPDLTLIQPPNCPLHHGSRWRRTPWRRLALLHGRSGNSICSLVSCNALMAWHPPKMDLMSLSHEGLDRLLDRVDKKCDIVSNLCLGSSGWPPESLSLWWLCANPENERGMRELRECLWARHLYSIGEDQGGSEGRYDRKDHEDPQKWLPPQ